MKKLNRLLTVSLLCMPLMTSPSLRADWYGSDDGFLAAGCAMPAMACCGPAGVSMAYAGFFSEGPPPGTIGETYTRVSHPIPEDKHPRIAMLAVRDMGAEEHITVQRMGGYRMSNGIWFFESSRPLINCSENIVRVEARQNANDIQPYKVKFVRLIPGRIVYLDF
ncbi:MAG: hypothetical protein R3C19_20450 [Planctomycetaceae bacterium]